MRRRMRWWQNLGGLMAACVLTLLVVSPMTTAAACLCDAEISSVGAWASFEQGGARHDTPPCDSVCCQSGHCHPGGQVLQAPAASLHAPVAVAARHAPTAIYALASRPTSGPDRPPRA